MDDSTDAPTRQEQTLHEKVEHLLPAERRLVTTVVDGLSQRSLTTAAVDEEIGDEELGQRLDSLTEKLLDITRRLDARRHGSGVGVRP